MINTLLYSKQLEAVGIPRHQAEAQVQLMNDIMLQHFASKQDLEMLRIEMNARFEQMDLKILQVEQRMTIKLGTIVSIAIGVAVALARMTAA